MCVGQAAREAGRLKLLKWETLARRKTKVTAELQQWLGMGVRTGESDGGSNATAVLAAQMAERVEAQQKAFNGLAKNFPVSLQSLPRGSHNACIRLCACIQCPS